ncbi:MAG TPA: DUF3592 domain-containing protein [Afifellaceae bacterium]|nr:DUF3592 domain-containing protein [Afifellaceae bacterium]
MCLFRQIGRRAAIAVLVAAPFVGPGFAAAQNAPDPSSLAGNVAASEDVAGDAAGDDAGSIVLATGLVFSLVGFAFAGSTIRTRRRADAATRWPRALATVESSEVVVETGRDTDGHLETHYVPVVRYSYEAAGRALRGSRIRVNDLAFSRRGKAQEIVAKYPAGTQVTMRYDPADPTNAVLETVKPGIATAIFGGVFVVLGVLLSLAGFASFG